MAVESQPPNQNSSTLVPSGVYSTSETVQPNLFEQFSQLQIEIQQLTDKISELETPSVFQPPHRLMPVEERLQLHYQSIKGEKERAKTLIQARETLVFKQEELEKLKPQLKQRQRDANKALKRLEILAEAVKQTENAYSQAMEEFHASAQLVHQTLVEAYGQKGHFLLETEVTPQGLAVGESFPQLTPCS